MNLLPTLRRVGHEVTQILFPLTCVGCGREGISLCSSCFAGIPRATLGHCPLCERLSAFGATCSSCRTARGLDGVVVGTDFDDVRVREAIHRAKYERDRSVLASLASLPLEVLVHTPNHPLYGEHNRLLVVPVPLHISRERERGFNQSEVLARHLVPSIGGKVVLLLRRTKRTAPQFDLPREKRLTNVRGAFALRVPVSLVGRSILLVDDVMTTGATLRECAKILKTAGASSVWGMVVARAM